MKPIVSMGFRTRSVALAAVSALALVVACSGRDRANGAGGESFKPPVEGQLCTPGQVRDCGIEIGRHGEVIDCARGTQTCTEDKSWSACATNGTTFKAAAPPARSGSPDPDLHSNAVGGSSTTCVDNPCNPYCQTFNDSPDTGVTSDSVTVVLPGPTISLEASNVPGGFQSKGSLDSQCASGPGTQAYNEACQFDMHCGTKSDGTQGCVPFVTGEKSCTGIDITAPPVCVGSETSTYRNLTVCNRGTVDLTQNIQCMAYPGNAPQFPEDNPGAGRVVLQTGSTVDQVTGTTNPISATNPLKAGECRTYRVANANFQSSGTESIMCNPPATSTPVTTTLLTLPTTAESADFLTKDNALSDTDSLASATTEFRYAGATTTYASSFANNAGFASPTALTGAPNSAGAPTALTLVTSSVQTPTSAINSSGGFWSASGGSTLLADVSSVDTKSASVSVDKNDVSWMLTKGYTIAGATGSITQLDIAVDATYTTIASELTGYVYLRKPDGTVLGYGNIRSGTISFSVAYGVLTAAELPNLEVWIAARALGWAGSANYTMSLNRIGVAGKYYDPSYAQIDATGYVWPAPPTGTYTSIDLATTWKASAASGAVIYAYVKRVSDNTTVASALFKPPTGYTAGTYITSTASATTTGLTAADLSGGLYVTLQAYPVDGGSLDVDAVAITPIYRDGNDVRQIRFKGFGLSVPPGATNVKLAAVANYKIDPLFTGDMIAGTVLSISGSTSTLISTSSATIATNAFTLYQLGYQTITDTTAIEDPKLTVDVAVKKGAGAPSPLANSIGSLDSLSMRLQYDATVSGSVGECNPSNNWTVNKANPSTLCAPVSVTTYPPWTVTRVFEATCPTNFRALWKYAGYTSTTPSGTKIEFRFRSFDPTVTATSTSCGSLPPVTTSPPAALATAQLSPDTQVCSLTAAATTTCPVNLANGLGTVDSRKQCLQMDAYGIPASTPAASPTLTDWRVTYDCLPEE
jgi:hypothetical protein